MSGAIESSLRHVAADLTQLGARWALVGGFAVSARADPRFTRDVDVCVVVSGDHEAKQVIRRLMGLGYAVDTIVEHEHVRRLATTRLRSPLSSGVLVDLLFASSGVEAEIVEGAEVLEILAGLTVPVAQAPHLVVLKLLARDDIVRPQDVADLRALRPFVGTADAEEVRRLVALVVDRQFHRGRDLAALAEDYLGTLRRSMTATTRHPSQCAVDCGW